MFECSKYKIVSKFRTFKLKRPKFRTCQVSSNVGNFEHLSLEGRKYYPVRCSKIRSFKLKCSKFQSFELTWQVRNFDLLILFVRNFGPILNGSQAQKIGRKREIHHFLKKITVELHSKYHNYHTGTLEILTIYWFD